MDEERPRSKRLLLLEFLFSDRYSQSRSKMFPFFVGYARALGVKASWISGWATPGKDSRTRYVIDLDEEAWAPIMAQVAKFVPTHVIISEKLDERLERSLQQRLPGVVIESFAEAADPARYERAQWLPDWLGVRTDGSAGQGERLVVDMCEPCYDNVCVPPPPSLPQPSPASVHVVVGPECAYRRPLSKSRFFDGVELSPGVRPFACSFCLGPPTVKYAYETPPIELALKQCRAAAACESRGSSRTSYVMDGAAVSLRIAEFFRGILAQPFPPSRFYFSFRIDELLHVAPHLDELLPALAEAGHNVSIYNMGVENFSEDENERLNKGLRMQQVDEVTERIAKWERLFPDTFQFTREGGFGLVLFTPWTTLEDLEINLDRMRRPGVGVTGFALTSKLQILPKAAIADLARQDGVLTDSFEDFHYYDSGCFDRYDERELPWRFLHREVAHLYQIGCRVAPITPFRDRLFESVQALYGARADIWCDPFEFFSDALDRVREGQKPQGPEEILDRLRTWVNRTPTLPGFCRVPRELMPDSKVMALARRLHDLLIPGGKAIRFYGFRIRRVEPRRDGVVRIELERRSEHQEESLILHAWRDDGKPRLAAVAGLAVAYAKETPPDSGAKRQALTAVVMHLRKLARDAARVAP